MSKDRTVAQRVARYTERSRLGGMVRVNLWVPADRVEEIKQIAAQMRQEAAEKEKPP